MWGVHFLQGIDGIGPEVAGRIYDHFGKVPLAWECQLEDLLEIEGVGKVRAAKLLAMFE
jgi:excinuclease UvrABC nuclease subunit